MSLQTKPQTMPLASTRFTSALERRVHAYIRKHSIVRPGERILVGLSGGPDSTTLLIILSRLSPQFQINLTAAHFDHMLRSREEAAGDARFVTEVTEALGVPLVTAAADVRSEARSGHRSLEDAARRLRYTFLGEQARAVGACCVSVGHTLDDQAETVLLHLVRGAGLGGLAGMRPRSAWPFGVGPDIARPLLMVRRSEIERYCRELGIEPRVDPTNRLPIATRNRLRHELMPVLRRLNPRIEESIARLAAVAAADSDYLDELARCYFPEITSSSPGDVSISRRDLLATHPAIARRLIRLALEEVGGAPVDVSAIHVEALLDALQKPPGGYSLPAGLTITTDDRSLTVRRGPDQPVPQIPETKLTIPGGTRAGCWTITAEITHVRANIGEATQREAYLDLAKSGLNLSVRSRRPGDRLRPLGLSGEKKLQDILVDAKVPSRERDGVPLVCAGDQIAWVAGRCIDERFAVTPSTTQVLHLIASNTPDAMT